MESINRHPNNGNTISYYRLIISVLFGLIGFAVNFLDLKLFESADFKVSILAGLFFPLIVALAWGWRYGFLSALAGGCQSMWWLWKSDGWGILYAVPVFTLWILWHGWWADRRQENHPWYESALVVEIPFRLIIEFGFYTVFPWLVSLNPPPWNPAIILNDVPSAWIHTVVIKHSLSAYILLLTAYATINLGPVRRFFGLRARPGQSETTLIITYGILAGAILWLIDSVIDYLIFSPGKTFWKVAILEAGQHEFIMRFLYVIISLIGAVIIARFIRQRAHLTERLNHQNRVLAAIRNINQLIVNESEPRRLVERACANMTETRGFYNAWIVLFNETGSTVKEVVSSGFNGDFNGMKECLERGELPFCITQAQKQDDLIIVKDPSSECFNCPLACTYADRAGLTSRLAFEGHVSGTLVVSVPKTYASDTEEQRLLKEIADDLSFALHKIEIEKRFHVNQKRYREIFESSRDGYVMVDTNGRIIDANQAYCDMLGYSLDELRDLENFYQITPARWREWERTEIWEQRLLKKHHSGIYEKEYIRKDGRFFPVELQSYVATNENGGIEFLWGIARDITDRKQAEQSLQNSEALYSSLVENLPQNIFRKDVKGRFTYVNNNFCQIVGLSKGDIIGRTDFDIFPSELAEKYQRDDRRVMESEELFETVEENVSTGGEQTFVQVIKSPLRNSEGAMIGLQGIFWDITENKKAGEILQESEERLRILFEKAADPIYISKLDGQLIQVNEQACRVTGYTREELLRMNVTDIDSETTPDTLTKFYESIAPDQPVAIESYHKRKDGALYPVEITISRMEIPNTIQFMGFARDITDRKRAEEALREGELRFRMIIESLPVGVFAHDMDGRLILINEVSCQDTGYSRDELLSMTVNDIDHSSLSRDARIDLWHKLKTGQARMIGTKHTRKDGSRYPTEIYRSAVILSGKRIVLAIAFDISDQVERETIYAKILETTNDGFWIVNEEGCVLEANPAAAKMLGYSVEEMKALSIGDINPLETCDDTKRRMDYLRDQGYQRFETRHRHKDGNLIDVEVSVSFSHFGKDRFVVFIRDITDRKHAEKELLYHQRTISLNNRIANVFLTSGQEDMYAEALDVILNALESRFGYFGYIDDSGDLICPSVTRDGWNSSQKNNKHFVYPKSSWGGFWVQSLIEKKPFLKNESLHSPVGNMELENVLSEPIIHRDKLIGHYLIANKPGGYSPEDQALLESVAVQTAPVLSALLEENRQKQEHEKLEAQYRQAQKMEAVGRLAGGIAHDFNNMLMVINGHAEIAQTNVSPSQPLYENLQEIKKAAQRSADLTRQLLAFARKQTVSPKVLNLNDTVEGMLKMLQRLIGEDIDLAWAPGTDLWQVKMDTSQIDQILANLCVNARDAIAGIGKVTIETGNVRFDEEYCSEHAGFTLGEYVQLAVSDNGCGMDKDTLAQVFDPFFTTKKHGEGTGLGLATVYGVVKQNGGFINVYSEPGQGTAFKIYFPRHTGEEDALQVKRDIKTDSRGSETVLLVEDEPSLQNLGAKVLERLGYRVLATSNPLHAIELAENHSGEIDLLLTDVIMPEMNGRDLADTLKAQFPNLKILFMSGYPDNVIDHHGILDKGVNFLEKPFMPESLTMKVRGILDSP